MAKTFIVTGASRGIGLAVAECLLGASHNVVVVARSVEALESVRTRWPQQVLTVVGDFLEEKSLGQRAVDCTIDKFGRLDGIVVNHGAMFGVNRLAECDIVDWQSMFDVNLFSAVAITKAAIPALRSSRGSIVYTSSGAAATTYSTWGAYSMSKAALNALARQVACEEPDISAFAIRPGVVDTEMQRELREVHAGGMDEKDKHKFQTLFESKRLLRPEQPGNVMARLAAKPDNSLSGQFLRIVQVPVVATLTPWALMHIRRLALRIWNSKEQRMKGRII